MKLQSRLAFVLSLLFLAAVRAEADQLVVGRDDAPGAVKIVAGATLADIYVDAKDLKLANIAAGLLADDVQRVTRRKPRVLNDPARLGSHSIIIGTIGSSELIDRLVAAKTIDVDDVRGRWETFKLLVVDRPIPNIESALVIVGSDRRGTAYGVFTVSEAMGVSPWYWWADVTPLHQDILIVKPATHTAGPPSIKYRGIFINDEDWGMQPWSARTFEPEFGDIGARTYEKVFELLLRLKGNYIWPAMHEVTIEFGKVEANIKAADDWGIVAGASHPEPMNRNNVDWPTLNLGEWRYDTNRERILGYWEEWAKKRGAYEANWTIGMRGVHDSGMVGPTDMHGRIELLEQAMSDQRDLLRRYVNRDIEKVAQIFTPYKEALEQYRAGLKVPEDVTIVWTEDNYGYIRQLSNPDEQKRKGGSGVYYHISYLGSPFSYVWLNTTPPALIWEEMSKAYAYGADRVWVLNVGDIKPGEIGIEFWMNLAWDVNAYTRETLPRYLHDWATRIFGTEPARDIAVLMDRYYRLSFARKPESLDPGLFSFVNYQEADRRLADYGSLLQAAESVGQRIGEERRDAYFELVLYPVRMTALMNELYICAGYSRFHAQQNDPLANVYAKRADDALARINAETDYFNNELVGGKWKHMMTARGTTSERWGFSWPEVQRVADTRAVPASEQATLSPPFATPPVGAPPAEPTGPPIFAETLGYLSIEAEHFTRNTPRNGAQWQVIPGLGRTGDSVAVYPVTVASIDQPEEIVPRAPMIEYDLTTTRHGDVEVTTYCLPMRRINNTRGLRYAIAVDDEPPQVVDFNEVTEGPRWSQNVKRNAAINSTKHKISSAGKHTLKVWMVDPGVVIDKIVIDMGGLKESYLGPPETRAPRY